MPDTGNSGASTAPADTIDATDDNELMDTDDLRDTDDEEGGSSGCVEARRSEVIEAGPDTGDSPTDGAD